MLGFVCDRRPRSGVLRQGVAGVCREEDRDSAADTVSRLPAAAKTLVADGADALLPDLRRDGQEDHGGVRSG